MPFSLHKKGLTKTFLYSEATILRGLPAQIKTS